MIRTAQGWTFFAWVVAVASSLGALFIGEVMGQTPCTLCWFQRTCMFPLAVILGVAAFRADPAVWRYGLPLAAVGLTIAAYHSLLYAGVISEALQPCTASGPSCSGIEMTIFGFLPLPFLAVAAFVLIIMALLVARRESLR